MCGVALLQQAFWQDLALASIRVNNERSINYLPVALCAPTTFGKPSSHCARVRVVSFGLRVLIRDSVVTRWLRELLAHLPQGQSTSEGWVDPHMSRVRSMGGEQSAGPARRRRLVWGAHGLRNDCVA